VKKTGVTNGFAIYQEDTEDTNYLAGSLGVGAKIPAANIHTTGSISAEQSISASSAVVSALVFKDGTSQTTAGESSLSGENLGSGIGIFSSMSSTTSQFKSIIAGTNIGITEGANDLTISADVAAGEGVPYVGATANVELGSYSLSATTISAQSICSYTVWARGDANGRTIRLGQFEDNTPTATYDFWYNDSGSNDHLFLRSARNATVFAIERLDATAGTGSTTALRFLSTNG